MIDQEGVRRVMKKRSVRCDYLDHESFLSLGSDSSVKDSKVSKSSYKRFNSMDSIPISESCSQSILSSRLNSDVESTPIKLNPQINYKAKRVKSFASTVEELENGLENEDQFNNNYFPDLFLKPKLIIDILRERAGKPIEKKKTNNLNTSISDSTSSFIIGTNYYRASLINNYHQGIKSLKTMIELRAESFFHSYKNVPITKKRRSIVFEACSKLSSTLISNEMKLLESKIDLQAYDYKAYKTKILKTRNLKDLGTDKHDLNLPFNDKGTEHNNICYLPEIKYFRGTAKEETILNQLKYRQNKIFFESSNSVNFA